MVTCGHQFQLGEECDWIISSSAVGPVNGNSTATNTLHNLFETHCKTRGEEFRGVFGESRESESDSSRYLQTECLGGSRLEAEELTGTRAPPTLVLEAREIQLAAPQWKKPAMRQQEGSGSDDPDESRHAEDCPIKWYYRRRTKNGWGPCVAMGRHADERRDQSGKKFRDRIPLEVKIGKISLNRRENEFKCLKRRKGHSETESYSKVELDPRVTEIQKKRLEAKLNWRPFQEDNNDDDDDGEESQISQDFSARDTYLLPRSVLGGKAPVSILLFPYHPSSNCSWERSAEKAPPAPAKTSSSVAEPPRRVSRPRTTQSADWETLRRGKRLQVPRQANFLFDAPKKRLSDPTGKWEPRSTRTVRKDGKNFTSLYYELEDKSNSGRKVDDEQLEKMIKDLSMLNTGPGPANLLIPGLPAKKKVSKEGRSQRHCRLSNEDHFSIICKQIKFSQRRPKSAFVGFEQTPFPHSRTNPKRK